MPKPVIEVEGLSKSYQLGETVNHDTLRDAIAHGFRSLVGRGGGGNPARGKEAETLWALKDVSFNVQEGDVLGIIGRNGAGKSTLLKILSRITDPTSGTARIRGRVASLLEVGTGFHPELTGRENIFMNGAILGMTRREMKDKFDEIVAFAEVERFIDTPVKRYSSGMYVRLAFAVAAHIDPEILIVDEVLAVGDVQFQKKCLGKMQDVSRGGRTVLFVSHNMQAVLTLCSTAILLSDGMVDCQGDVHSVVNSYLGKGEKNITNQFWDDTETAPGNEFIRIRSVRLIPKTEGADNVITINSSFYIEFVFSIELVEATFYIGMHFRTVYGELIFVTASVPQKVRQGVYRYACFIPGGLLNNGTYSMETYFVRDSNVVLYIAEDIPVFEVHDVEREPGAWLGEMPGAVRPKLRWEAEQVASG